MHAEPHSFIYFMKHEYEQAPHFLLGLPMLKSLKSWRCFPGWLRGRLKPLPGNAVEASFGCNQKRNCAALWLFSQFVVKRQSPLDLG